MKFGLLCVLVVAELLPNLSEGRIVSKCELKEKLEEKIYLPRHLAKHKEEILSIMICEVSLKSNMSTSLVNVDGIRVSLSTDQPPTEGIEPETIMPVTAAPTAPPPATTTTTTTTTTATTTITATTTTTAAFGGSKKRRSPRELYAHYSLSDMENLFDEEDMQRDDEQMSSSKEDRTDPNKISFWSIGYYGIFQLSDSHFCDSGYRWSKNICGKLCSDFTDDDITDDIDCLVNTNYDWYLFRRISRQCFDERKTFLQDCA